MKTKWICEHCDSEFRDEQECIQHELECDQIELRICEKCDDSQSWTRKNDGDGHYAEGWHRIHLGRMGYGSNLDGCDVNFTICDKCLCEFIATFKHKEGIYNSGSNTYYSDDEDWDIE